MLRKFMYGLSAFLVVGLAAPFVLKDSRGKTLLNRHDVTLPPVPMPQLPNLPEMPDVKGALFEGKKSAPKDIPMYRWMDADGVWHFSDTPSGSGASEVKLDPANVIPEPEYAQPEQEKKAMPGLSQVVEAYANAPELADQARDARDQMNARNQNLVRTLDSY